MSLPTAAVPTAAVPASASASVPDFSDFADLPPIPDNPPPARAQYLAKTERLGTALSVTLIGLSGHVIEIEAAARPGLPALHLTGLPDASVHEAQHRVNAALSACGVRWPAKRLVVNMWPASVPKTGTGFDLALAVALVGGKANGVIYLAELRLDGRLAPVRGVLPAVQAARAAGISEVVVAEENRREAELVPEMTIRARAHLSEVLKEIGVDIDEYVSDAARALTAPEEDNLASSTPETDPLVAGPADGPDLADILGQTDAKAALTIAAAGGHHMLMTGPPGAGKTMLASALPTILPPLNDEQALEVTAMRSITSADTVTELIRTPPFAAPHHSSSASSITGGGAGIARPGAISLAHHGVLFLDEIPEFNPRILQLLRQPLESGEIILHRARAVTRYPARFQLIGAANPCPCGKGGNGNASRARACECSPAARRRYLGRLSGPLLDRIDVRVTLPPVSRADLHCSRPSATSAQVREQVRAARAAQNERWAPHGFYINAQVPGALLRATEFRLPPALVRPLDKQVETGTLSLRGYDRIVRLAWTCADMAGRDKPASEDIARAVFMRSSELH